MLGYTTDKISDKVYDEFCELASKMCEFLKNHTESFDPMTEISITAAGAEILQGLASYQSNTETEVLTKVVTAEPSSFMLVCDHCGEIQEYSGKEIKTGVLGEKIVFCHNCQRQKDITKLIKANNYLQLN